MYVVKKVHFDKVTVRLSYGLSIDHCDPVLVYKGVTSSQLDELAAAALTANHPHYAFQIQNYFSNSIFSVFVSWIQSKTLLQMIQKERMSTCGIDHLHNMVIPLKQKTPPKQKRKKNHTFLPQKEPSTIDKFLKMIGLMVPFYTGEECNSQIQNYFNNSIFSVFVSWIQSKTLLQMKDKKEKMSTCGLDHLHNMAYVFRRKN
ncbi:hypothetical protein CTI12_AA222660 [Artemisia annua]|uniref:Uncharacterized protein n=1 Tax=Artemisia annua TaxID=35608 RepID=A0A2U1NV68_ARTAN|nr:hypothetical protein CTI12_AA222660 [Artemisia annua]